MIQATSNLLQGVDRIATAIRNVFAVEGDLPESDVEKLHVELVAYVSDANARLKHCDDLLRRGLRQEALQECNEEPNLLDLVTRLDFPEWDAWADYVAQFSLPPQPALLLDVAAELNEAYSKAQSLDGLLRMHRLHSLARSPLSVRLGVLRNIAAKDPQNPAWRTDLEAFEGARLKQLRADFLEQNARDNLPAITALRREIEDASWIVRPPAALLDEVVGGHRRLVAKSARERLASLEPVINDAFSAFDVPTALAAREQWKELWPLSGLTDGSDLATRVRPAFEWLDEEEAQQLRQVERQRAIASLEEALNDASASLHRLMRLYDAVERFEEPLQERLQRRYDERLRSLETTEHRKHRLTLISGFAAVVVIAAIVGVIAFKKTRSSETTATVDAISKFLQEKQPERALEFYESRVSAKPFLAAAPQVQALHADIKAQLKDDLARRERVDSLLNEAERLAATATWEAVGAATKTLKEAKEILRGEEEQVRLLDAEREVARTEGALQLEVDEQFKKDVAALTRRIAARPSSSSDNLQPLLTEARELTSRRRVSATAKQAVGIDLVARKLEDQAKSIVEAQRREEALRSIVNAIGSESTYKRALNAYLIVDSTSARATDFHNVIAEDLGELERLDDWNKLADQWNGLSLQEPEDASQALQMIDSLQKNYASYPGVSEAAAIKPYLESVKAREKSDGGKLLDDLRSILKDDIFNMSQIKAPGGEGYIYYLSSPKQTAANTVTVTAILDSRDPKQSATKSFHIDKFSNANPSTVSRDTPQKAFAKSANAAMSDANATYESVACRILDLLLKDADMDPILKCRLLQVFYDRAAPGSSILTEELRGFREGIESTYALEDVNFIADESLSKDDPRAADAEHAAIVRTNTEELLKRVSPESPDGKPASGPSTKPKPSHVGKVYLTNIGPRVAKIIDGSMNLPRLQWRAGIFKAPDGGWTLRSSSAANDGREGELALIRRGDNGELAFTVVGVAKGNSLNLQQNSVADFREGKPVLFVETNP